MMSTTPFCKFCFDKGYSNYNNHWLREDSNSNSNVTCPILLNNKCKYWSSKRTYYFILSYSSK